MIKITMTVFLFQASRHVGDLFVDLQDGHNLISLLEVLSGEHLVSTVVFVAYFFISKKAASHGVGIMKQSHSGKSDSRRYKGA